MFSRFNYIVPETHKTLQELPVLKGSLPEIKISPPAPAPSDPQLLLLRSIEWTTFHEATYDTALEQANVILRYFLGKPFLAYVRVCALNTRHPSLSEW
jgi:hypothetical protein